MTPPGAKDAVFHVLTHTYEEPGDYYVTWHLENKVSKINVTKMVRMVLFYCTVLLTLFYFYCTVGPTTLCLML